MNGQPRRITPDEFERGWPRATTKVIVDGIAVDRSGRIVGRTIAGIPHYDLLLDDGSRRFNVPAADVTMEKAQ